jgi:hypothetical protein
MIVGQLNSPGLAGHGRERCAGTSPDPVGITLSASPGGSVDGSHITRPGGWGGVGAPTASTEAGADARSKTSFARATFPIYGASRVRLPRQQRRPW